MSHPETYLGLPAGYQPRIHLAEVTRTQTISAGMIRVTLSGSDMADYPTTGIGDEYVRLFLPDSPELEVRQPFLTDRGWDYPDGVEPAVLRTYTIRQHRPGEVDIDFVIHEGGPAASWAMQTRPGYQVALNPPVSLYNRPGWAHRQLLVADEPALPAALRIAELTAAEVETTILAEVPSTKHQLTAKGVDLKYVWLRGTGNGRGPTSLVAALRRTPPSEATYVWVAGETKMTREARKLLRHELALPADAYKCIGYWIDHSEEWFQRYEQLGSEFEERVKALYASERDTEEIIDEINTLYENAGL